MLDISTVRDYNSSAAMKCNSLTSDAVQYAHFCNELVEMSRMLGLAVFCLQKSYKASAFCFGVEMREESTFCSTWNKIQRIIRAGWSVAYSWGKSCIVQVPDRNICTQIQMEFQKRTSRFTGFFGNERGCFLFVPSGYIYRRYKLSAMVCRLSAQVCTTCSGVIVHFAGFLAALFSNASSSRYVFRAMNGANRVFMSIMDSVCTVGCLFSSFLRERISFRSNKSVLCYIYSTVCSTWNI